VKARFDLAAMASDRPADVARANGKHGFLPKTTSGYREIMSLDSCFVF
jgi:hypothetical protein